MIVVAIIGIIVSIAVPAFLRSRENSRGRACQENLCKLEGAKMQLAAEKKLVTGTAIDNNLLWNTEGTGYLKVEPKCPADKSDYVIGNVDVTPTCPNFDAASVFVQHTAVGAL